jgi:hypothetical protein
MRLLLAGALTVVLFAATSTAPSPKMSDPLFAIEYDPQKVHFEKIPSLLAARCESVRGYYVAAWVYGHLKSTNSEYFFISGLITYHADDATGAATDIGPEEDDGLIVALQGSQCLVDQAGYFFSQQINPARGATPIKAPESVVNKILQDAFETEAKAFGARERYLKLADPKVLVGPAVEQFGIYRKELQEQNAKLNSPIPFPPAERLYVSSELFTGGHAAEIFRNASQRPI